MTELELDVRPLPKPEKHPAIFGTYDDLSVGESFVLVNNHEPRHLRDEFEADHPGSYHWEYIERGPQVWRIRITKHASTPLPRVLVNTRAADGAADAAGAVWKLEPRDRDLDANVIALPPGGGIGGHIGPDLDVLIHVLDGAGEVRTELGAVALRPGDLVWLPAKAQRQFSAGPHGLRYLTVHRRRQALVLEAPPRKAVS